MPAPLLLARNRRRMRDDAKTQRPRKPGNPNPKRNGQHGEAWPGEVETQGRGDVQRDYICVIYVYFYPDSTGIVPWSDSGVA